MNPTFFSLMLMLQLFLSVAVIWGIYHEEKLIEFEDQITKKIFKK